LEEPSVEAKTTPRRDYWFAIAINLATAIVAGVVAGGVLLWYQIHLNSPHVHYTLLRLAPERWELRIRNDSDVPDYGLFCHLTFDKPVRRHEQTSGAFASQGIPLEGGTVFSGMDRIDFKSDLVPPRSEFFVRFSFGEPLGEPPQIDVITAHGGVGAQ
jgi:hypothetical protein